MDLRELRAFLTVAEELNFRRAAERLHMSQPPLTRLIAGLERRLRAKLFVRNTQRVALTPAGRLLADRGPALLGQVEALEAKVREKGREPAQVLRVGLTNAGFRSWVPAAIAEFERAHPGTAVELTADVTDRLLRDLRLGRIDLACVEASRAPGADRGTLLVAEDPVGVLMPKAHRLAGRREVRLRDLAGETFVVHPRHEHAHVYESQRRVFRDAGVRAKLYTKRPAENCPVLVARGKGLSLTGLSHASPIPANTVFVPLADSGLKIRLELVWKEPLAEGRLGRLLGVLRRSAPRSKPSTG